MLTIGSRLGPYEILATLGAGGMGEVYRALDTRLNRDVAIKVLPASVANDPEHLARFQREAQLLAAVNHPNIAHIYGLEGLDPSTSSGQVGQQGRIQALVMELVDGPTLHEHIEGHKAQGRGLSITETLTIARQIADALEAAHERGIIHRDLKPANVKVTPEGVVKVLDFGLAKAFETAPASSGAMTNSPTLSMRATQAGLILGTAAYMAPEQATGHPVDKRADVWAFGVVLWEMLTGTSAFAGETISHTLAFVITKEPDWNTLPPSTPPSIRRLLRRALEKDRKRRLPDIGSARLEIDEALAPPTTEDTKAGAPIAAAPRAGWRSALPWALVAAFATGLVLSLAMWAPWRRPVPLRAVRLTTEIGADASLGVSGTPLGTLALSPDGSLLAFVAQLPSGASQLYIRRLDQLQAVGLSGTDGARNPFFSPDGQWVGFAADQKLKKISITGGAAVTVCDATTVRGAAWGEDGTIVFSPSGAPGAALVRVPDGGGTPVPATKLARGEVTHRWPQTLPGGKAVLFTSNSVVNNYEDANILVQQLPNGPSKVVQRGGLYPRYVPSGHLLYVHGGTLFAAPFDVDRLEITGQAVPVQEGVNASPGTGSANLAVSNSGTLVYLSGQTAIDESPMYWMDHTGQTTPLRAMPANWSNPRFSPDGTRIAMDIVMAGANPAVWTYDWSRDTATRLTFGTSASLRPLWTPDGQRIVFTSTLGDGGNPDLYWQRADGTGDAQRLTTTTTPHLAGSWHPNGKILALHEINPRTSADIWILTVEGDEATGWKPGKPVPFLNSPANESDPKFSPDGKWIAYQSNESGRAEVYVRPFPASSGKWQVSTGGGSYPIWSRSRSELFYSSPSQEIMVAAYKAEGGSFLASKPQAWGPGRFMARPRLASYDLHPDGNRFALASAQGAPASLDKVVFVFNFFDELRRLAPATSK